MEEFRVTRTEAKSARGERFPTVPLFGALGFVCFAFAAVLFGQATEIGTVRMEIGEAVEIRDIVMTKAATGDIVEVRDFATGDTLAAYAVNEGGFVRGAFRGLARNRMVANVPETQPYRLIRWSSGAVSLSDTGTGERLYLDAYGRDNVAAFAQFLEGQEGI
jgi:putative photosynthetic complex assembly protein